MACYAKGWVPIKFLFVRVRALKLDSSSIVYGDLDRALVRIGLHTPPDWDEKCMDGMLAGDNDMQAYLDKVNQAKKKAIDKEKQKPQ